MGKWRKFAVFLILFFNFQIFQFKFQEPSSPRSPNGFYYPPTPSHYHHSQATISNGNGLGPTHHPPIHAYGSPAQQHQYPPNGYNGNGSNGYSGNAQYMQRGPPPIGKDI